MIKFVAAAVMTLPALIGVPQAGADPEDHVPYCSGDQTPMNNNCRPAPSQSPGGNAPGANPDVPTGLNPGVAPVV